MGQAKVSSGWNWAKPFISSGPGFGEPRAGLEVLESGPVPGACRVRIWEWPRSSGPGQLEATRKGSALTLRLPCSQTQGPPLGLLTPEARMPRPPTPHHSFTSDSQHALCSGGDPRSQGHSLAGIQGIRQARGGPGSPVWRGQGTLTREVTVNKT